MDAPNKIVGLKVSVVSEPEDKVSQKGSKFLRFKAVAEGDNGDKLWLQVLAFGRVGRGLVGKLSKGKKMLISGSLKTEEKPDAKNPGQVYVNRTVFLNEAKVAVGDELVTIDEFYTEKTEPF